MTEIEQLKVALQVCQVQRNRGADETIDAQTQAATYKARADALQKQVETLTAELDALKLKKK